MQFVQFFLRCRIEFLLLSVELKRDIIITMYRFFDRADIILESSDVGFESASKKRSPHSCVAHRKTNVRRIKNEI